MSDVTLSAAVRSSLLALQNTTDLIDRTNNRLSSGLRVASSVDDPVSFFSAKALNDRAFDFNERKDGIDQGISTVTAALDGVEGIESLVRQLKGIATSLKSASAPQFSDLIAQFNDIRTQVGTLASDSEFQGVNLIDNTTESLTVSFANNTTSLLTVQAIQLKETGLGIDSLEIRADSKVSFTATPTSGVSLNVDANTTLGTGVSGAGNTLVVTYNGTGVSLSSGGEITFALNTQISIKIEVGTGNSATLTLELQTFEALQTGYATVFGTANFTAATAVSVGTGTFFGIVSGNTGSLLVSDTSGNVNRAVASTGAYQTTDFLTEGQSEDLDAVIQSLDSALSTLRTQSQKLGSNVALLQTRLDFTETYVNTLEEGASKLTLADLNEEGANLLALQTRQQLGISALAFAGQSEQGILSLFG